MKKIVIILSIAIAAVISANFIVRQLVTTVYAQDANVGDTEVESWGCEGLQEQINEYGGGRASELPKYCNEGEVYQKIVYWLYYILGIGAVIFMIYGGYMYMTARGNDAQTKKAKQIIMYTIAGVALAIIATAIVTIGVNLVVDNKLF